MKIKFIITICFLSIIISSCDTNDKEEHKNREKFEKQKEVQLSELQSIITKTSAIQLQEEDINLKFSFELENQYNNQNLVIEGKILDIIRKNDTSYILFSKAKQVVLRLSLKKNVLNKIIKIRQNLIESDYFFDNYRKVTDIPFTFIINQKNIKRNTDLYKSIGEYDFEVISEENSRHHEVELVDYTIELELESDGFFIEGEAVDIVYIDQSYY